MREIKQIVEYINDEVEGAEEYIKFATKMKGVDDMAYQTALKLAQTELEHVDAWHSVVVKTIETKRATMKSKGQEIPQYMQDMWDEEHVEIVEKVAKLKYKLEFIKK